MSISSTVVFSVSAGKKDLLAGDLVTEIDGHDPVSLIAPPLGDTAEVLKAP